METTKEPADVKVELETFIRHAKEYAETRYDLAVINVQEKTTDIISTISSALIVGILILFTLLFTSIGAAWYIGQIIGNPSSGFFCVALFYLVLSVIIIIFRDTWIRIPIINFMIKKISLHEED
jgi:uncharacterized membrane protein YqjE